VPDVYGFVNAADLQKNPSDIEVLKAWRAAELPLGNHGWSHMNLNQHTAQEWEADVLRDEPTIEPSMKGADWHWFRYPFLAEGNTPEKARSHCELVRIPFCSKESASLEQRR
jgi:peptidoglycan-N-acetylglucosamine deacetylase